MNPIANRISKDRRIICGIKGVACTFIVVGLCGNFFKYGFGSIADFTVQFPLIAAIAVSLCFSVVNFGKIYDSFKNSEKKKGFLYALYFSVHTVLLFNPLESARTEVTKFNRVIGSGLALGVDVVKRNNNFNHFFLYFAISFSLFFLLANYLKSKEYQGENKKAIVFLDNIIVIADIMLLLKCITFFYSASQETSVFNYSDYIVSSLILLGIAYILLNLQQKLSVDRIEELTLNVWMISLPVSIFITREWSSGKGFLVVQIISAIVLFAAVKIGRINWNKKWVENSFGGVTAVLSFIPFGTSFYIEFVTLLNQHHVFWTHLLRNYFYAFCIVLLMSLFVALRLIKSGKQLTNWKSFSYPAIVFGLSCLWSQIPISGTYNVDIFETANTSVLISDFLNYADIPIIQHYGGHMMSGVWEGIIYGLLNNDYMGASFSPYAGYVKAVVAILFFYSLKALWNEDAAILITLFIPFYSLISYWGLGLMMPLAVMLYMRKNTYTRAALVWFSAVWCTLYRLDLGFPFAIASFLVLFLYYIRQHNFTAVKQLSVTLITYVLAGFSIWCVSCIIKGIHPFNRLIEFLMISMSNQNWGYANIGDSAQTRFAWAYILVPLCSIICLLFTLFSRRLRNSLGDYLWAFSLIIGLSYFFNFSRGLVRHSLVENTIAISIWSVYFFLSIFLSAFFEKRSLILPSITGFILLNALFSGNTIPNERTIADAAVTKVGDYTDTWTSTKFYCDGVPMTYWSKLYKDGEVIDRVMWSEELKNTVQDYQQVIDSLLSDGETFVDCINKTSIYPLLQRQDPVYVSQSPLQLSGQFTQEEFIKEISGIPVVLMPCDSFNNRASELLDGIPNFYRYYKVFEYIYTNYVPLCTVEDLYAIWCLPERYDEYSDKISFFQGTEVDISAILATSFDVKKWSLEAVMNPDGSINLNYTGIDPMVVDIQNIMDLSDYVDGNVQLSIQYSTDTLGLMQLFFTTDMGEEFTGEKVQSVMLEKQSGEISFEVPVTEYTRLRLDIPEGSRVQLKSLRTCACDRKRCRLVDYGYDGPYTFDDGQTYSFLPGIHNYELFKLPLIWAERDTKESVDNQELTKLTLNSGIYTFDLDPLYRSNDGNYLKAHIEYDSIKQNGVARPISATMKLGTMIDGAFETKYQYSFIVEDGCHDYMLRVSNDYYWYTDAVDSVILESPVQLKNISMAILQGD